MGFRRSHFAVAVLALCAGLLVLAAAALAVDTRLIVFQAVRGADKTVGVMDANGNVKRLGPGLQPAISRDGRTIVFLRGSGSGVEVYAMDADGGDVRQVTDDRMVNTEPALSADGKRVVFVGDRVTRAAGKPPAGEKDNIFVIGIDGSGERQLTRGPSQDAEPSFSVDGGRIAFIRGPGETRLMTMSADGGDVTPLTQFKDPFSSPSSPGYSPNGGRILFQAFAEGNRIFSFLAADGSDLEQLTRGDDEGVEPAYSPDGDSVVFRRGPNLFSMGADGSKVRQLTDLGAGEGSYIHPTWGR